MTNNPNAAPAPQPLLTDDDMEFPDHPPANYEKMLYATAEQMYGESMTEPDVPQPCQEFTENSHDWQEEYYGWKCSKCGDFIPFGCEPWMPVDEYEEDELDYD